MTIQLPHDLETSIEAVVNSGQFASVDAAMAEAARLLLRGIHEGRIEPTRATQPAGMGSIGAMHEDADLLGEVTQAIMHSRETRTLRLPPDE
ncbi:MAG: hypothetical protein ACHRXM_01690 [Isosphaerales bacterium]